MGDEGEIKITCTNINCPERNGGECTAAEGLNTAEAIAELFLSESNAIEGITDKKSLKQAITAWRYLVEQPKLTGGVILKTHKILMLHQPLYPNEKGYWRRCDVTIGGRLGAKWQNVPDLMAQWINRTDLQVKHPGSRIEADIKEQHVQYEIIHPFVDGNGRTGRMFMNWQRLKVGLPIQVIFDADKRDYYKWFELGV